MEKGCGQAVLSFIVDGNINWYNFFGGQFVNILQNFKCTYIFYLEFLLGIYPT